MTRTNQDYLVQRINPQTSYDNLLRFPSFFELETIHACNSRCIMCPGMAKNRPVGPMKSELFSKIVDEIAAHREHVIRVSLFRDGEPLMDPHIHKRIAEVKDAGIRSVGLTSNMSLMTEERSEAVLRAGIDRLDMSIDGITKETFEAIRRGLDFETVMANAQRFITLRDQLRPSCVVRLHMTLQESNTEEWPRYEAFWKPKLTAGHDVVFYHRIHNWGGHSVIKPVSANVPTLVQPCVSLWSLMPILVDGRSAICGHDFDLNYTTGDVNSDSIANIWRNAATQAFRDKHLANERRDIDICKECTAWDYSSHQEEQVHP